LNEIWATAPYFSNSRVSKGEEDGMEG